MVICCWQHSLTVLNISGNGITSLADLQCLHQMRQLSATDNSLSDVGELSQLLSASWRRLERLDVANNPLSRRNKYRDHIIIAAPALGTLIYRCAREWDSPWNSRRNGNEKHISIGVGMISVGVEMSKTKRWTKNPYQKNAMVEPWFFGYVSIMDLWLTIGMVKQYG